MAGYSIEKLNASNYSSWSMDMKFVLMERGLWEIVNGAELSPEKSENLDKDLREYKSRCNMAISLIKSQNNVEFRQISYNHSLGDLARVWFTIGNICAQLMENRFVWWLSSRLVHNWQHLRPAHGKSLHF
ncbi:hypothetical protein AVEN_123509-1 [Araneus ventricosus]|uniref:DUF4219 domain-containing protein n=1 Tax=Araneus ventricosus TaxID=182803 RepID=A0A4Y2GRI7_ARAVE|nr:hypothetical protein AVEN_123509-1 [Araneus ventricosus]